MRSAPGRVLTATMVAQLAFLSCVGLDKGGRGGGDLSHVTDEIVSRRSAISLDDLDPTKPFFDSVKPAVLPAGATTLPDAVTGTPDVGPDGSATYQFPLEIPDGVEGMKPSLGISYRARRGVGLLGPGWNLDGMSAIVRCRRSLAQDGFDTISTTENGVPKFLRDQTYCLDGVRLVHKVTSIPPNEVGAEFYPEDGTPTKVVVDTTDQTGSTTTLLDQPASFRVYFPDGRIGYYGTTSSSRVEYSNSPGSFLRYAFYVEKIADRFGNSIDFTYTRAAPTAPSDPTRVVEPMPDRITYTSFGTTAGPHQISFAYQTASKPRLRYIETLAIETTTVLKSIAVNSDFASFDGTGAAVPGAIRFYNFTYNTSSGTGFSVLNQIQRCTAKKNGSGTWVSDVCTSATTVGWTANTTNTYQRFALDNITDIVPAGAQNYGRITIADVNNDGLDDLVYKVGVDSQCAKWVYRLSTGTGSFGNAVDMNLAHTCSNSSQVGAKFLSDVFPVNLDGRGAVDFVTPVMDAASGFTHYAAARTVNNSGTPSFVPFDLDVLASPPQGLTATDPNIGFGEFSPMEISVIRPAIPAGQATGAWNAYKLTGDSVGVMSSTFQRSIGTYFKNWPPVFFDLNGDGFDELVNPDSTAYLFTPDPVNFGTNLPVLRAGDFVTGRSWFMDVNGDGHKDVAYISASDTSPGSIVRVRLNKGDYSFGPDISTPLIAGWNIGVSGIRSGIDIGVRVADVNLDGLDDMLLVDNGAALTSGSVDNGTFAAQRTSVQALISRGDGTFSTSQPTQQGGNTPIPLGDVATGYDGVPAPLQGYRLTQTLDANGDGLTDIVQTEGGKLRLYQRTGSAPELVTTITEGGARTITYHPTALIPTFGIATVGCREALWPRTCGARGLWVISALNVTGPVPHNLSYEYQDPSIDRAGRGFQGFALRKIRDQERGSLTKVEYSDVRVLDTQSGIQPAKYFYAPFTRVTEYVPQVSGKLLIITNTNNVPAATVVDGRMLIQDRTGGTTVSDCTQIPFTTDTCAEPTPRTLSSRTYERQYDSYGHATFSDVATTIAGQGDEHRQKQVVYSDPDLDNWLINVPNTSYDTSFPAGAPFGTTLVTEYDTDGIRLRSRTTPGNDGDEYKQERYHYDDRGRLYETLVLDSVDQDEFTARRAFTSFGPGGIYPTGLTVTTSINVTQTVALTWRHPAYGYLVQQVDANNVVHKQTFDTSGLPLSKSDSRSSPTIFTYGLLSSGTRWQVTSTFGSEKQIDDLDELGRVVNHAWTDSTGATVAEARGYDVFGNLSSVRSNFSDGNYETSYGFDNLDRATSRCLKASRTLVSGTPVAPTFECSQYTYDGNNTTVVGPDGITTTLSNDELGRLSTRVRSGTNPGTTTVLTETSQFTYGYFDKLSTVITPSGTVSYTYDNLNRLATMSRGTSVTSYGYNSFGEVLTETHSKDPSVVGQSPEVDLFILRDLAGRPKLDNGGSYIWDTAANGKWQLASTQSTDGISTTHAYDNNGMPATVTWGIGVESFAIDRTYDAKGRLDTLTYPQAGTFGRLAVKYTYNQFTGLVDSLTDLGTNKILWKAVTRNSAGVIRSETMNDGQVNRSVQLYEGSLVPYNVTFQNGTTTVLNEDLLYYPGGNLMARRSTLGASVRTEQLVFDGLNRVSTWTPNDNSASNLVTYGYASGDEIGSRSVSNETVTYTNTSVPGNSTTNFISRLSLTNSQTSAIDAYDSDALGRTSKTPAGTFTYGPYDLPKSFAATDGVSVDYLYDTFRSGVVKNISNEDQDIALAGLFRRIRAGSAIIYQHALVADGRVVGTIEHSSTDGAYANVEFYHRDQVGSVRAIAANATTVARNGTIDPYGNQVGSGVPVLPSDSASVAGSDFHGFQSQRHDLRAGLIDMNGRYYSPRIGRFMSDDPVIGDPMNGQSYDPKAFVFGNPTAFTDPTGFCGDPEGYNPCPQTGPGFGDWKGWENAARTVGRGIRDGWNGTGRGITSAYHATAGGIDDAYHATVGWFKDQYNAITQTRGPAVPSAPTTPISDQSSPTTVSGGTNQHSATEITTGVNTATSLGNSFMRGVPGAHFVRLSEDAFRNGSPVLGGVYAVASVFDAATVVVGGEGAIVDGIGVRGSEVLATRGGARFIAREAGEILDVTRVRIPGPVNSPFGKVDYLLGNVGSVESVGKGGFFRGVLGFGEGNLGPALERHLIENFGSASIEGSRIRAVGTMIGANGRAATVQSVWQVTADGFVDLITAVPK